MTSSVPSIGILAADLGAAVAAEVSDVGLIRFAAPERQLVAAADQAVHFRLQPDGVAGGPGPVEGQVGHGSTRDGSSRSAVGRLAHGLGDSERRGFVFDRLRRPGRSREEREVEAIAVDLLGRLGVSLAHPDVAGEVGEGRGGRGRWADQGLLAGQWQVDPHLAVAGDFARPRLALDAGLGLLLGAAGHDARLTHVLGRDPHVAQQPDGPGPVVAVGHTLIRVIAGQELDHEALARRQGVALLVHQPLVAA